MTKATGLGWDPVKNTITASEEQWADLIKVHKDIRRFRKGPPDNLEWLEKMFQKASVTGKSSVMPGAEEDDIVERQDVDGIVGLEVDDEGTPQPSPLPMPKMKRWGGGGGGASAIPCGPKRPKKDPYGKDFKRFVDRAISEEKSEASSNVSVANDIDAIMEEVVKCGAPKTSDGYYIATKLFGKLENRCFFYAMKTSEGRLQWLKRQMSWQYVTSTCDSPL
ncbi:hypothetical protein BRADI_1g36941v3 [Brachypodium distachyon]|uniref:Myb/SANT-like domain-containing protein n=1 Tax=Brachypodium distachyon TaxID=15368 RepID=A0A0Q3H5V1_BRADI|nr:hypothetical protein BRADI_1g36941v3 [Brachypodium distachyon]